MAETVLVVGGSGFIGSYVCKALVERGDRVVNFDLRPTGGALAWRMADYLDSLTFEQGSVESWEQLLGVVKRHRPSQIVHLAASINTDTLTRNPKMAFDLLAGGTIHVLEAARLWDVQRLVFFSSIGVLPTVRYQPIDANHPTLTATEGPGSAAYGAGKLAGEAFCWAYREAYNLDMVILRPSAAYGFHTTNPIFLNEMLAGVLRGEPVHFAQGREVPRDYTHVEDIAGITVAALNVASERLAHRVFYAASGQRLVTAGEVAEMITDLIPSARIEIAGGLSYIDQLEIRIRGLLDVQPVADQLGYTIRYTDLRAGIAEYAAHYSAYLASLGQTPAPMRA